MYEIVFCNEFREEKLVFQGRSMTIASVAAAVAMACIGIAEPAGAQSTKSSQLRPGNRFLSVWAGGSWSSRFGPAYSSIPTRPYAILSVRSEYVVEAKGPLALSFFMEAIPAIVVGDVPRYHTLEFWQPPTGPMRKEKIWDAPAPVYGAGLTPMGLLLYGTVSKNVRLFVSSSGGVAWFTRDMPVPDARQLNFLADLGGGMRVARENGAFLLGVKFQHMSNANLGRQNPGIDGNVVYGGFSKVR